MKCCRQETRRSVRRGTVELPYPTDTTCYIRLRASGLRRYKPVRRLEAWEQNGGANQGGGGGEARLGCSLVAYPGSPGVQGGDAVL